MEKREIVNHINSPSLPALMPEIGFCTYKLTGRAALIAMGYALQVGYRHSDTAQFYGNEEELGLVSAARQYFSYSQSLIC